MHEPTVAKIETGSSPQRENFRRELSDHIGRLRSPDEIICAASELLGTRLGAVRVFYAEYDKRTRSVLIRDNWTAPGIESVAGQVKRVEEFGEGMLADILAGRVVVNRNVTQDPRSAASAAAYAQLDIGAEILVPLVRSDELRVILAIHSNAPRDWSDEDLWMAQDVAESTWLAVETTRTEAELRAARDLSRSILDSMVEGFTLLGRDWTILDVNELGAQMTGRPREQLVGRNHQEAVPESVGSNGEAMLQRVFETGQAGRVEYFHQPPNSATIWTEVRAYLIPEGHLAVFYLDISERKRIEQELLDANRRKDEFLAMLAHELRNPLAPIKAAADLLAMAPLDEARLRKTSAVIARQVSHMSGLLDDLLDVSRVTHGLVGLDKVTVDLKAVVHAAVEQTLPLIHLKRQALDVHLPSEAATAVGDEKRLIQVLSNLLTNAAKYTPEGGRLDVRVDLQGENVSIVVCDSGIGMAPALVEEAFDLFSQADRTADREQGGLGLGLALVKGLVELHGGTVSAASKGLGKGSQFTVCLPRNAAPAVAPETDHVSSLQPLARSTTVLLVDDNEDAATMLALVLEALGCRVIVEHNSMQALERARAERPDVCLLDIGLPEMDGNELAARLRSMPETQDALLIAVTGYGREEDRQRTRSAGFDHHLVKPLDTARLAQLIVDSTRNKRAG